MVGEVRSVRGRGQLKERGGGAEGGQGSLGADGRWEVRRVTPHRVRVVGARGC